MFNWNGNRFNPNKNAFFRLIRLLLFKVSTYRAWYLVLGLAKLVYKISNGLIIATTLVTFGLVIFDFGFHPFFTHHHQGFQYLVYALMTLRLLYVLRFITEWTEIKKLKAHLYNLSLVILSFYLTRLCSQILALPEVSSLKFIILKSILFLGVFFLFLTETSSVLKYLYNRRQNPEFVFLASFAVLIVMGTLLLLLPNATHHGISPVNALFTSASAICVTGLTVLDTAQDFTMTGKVIILILIQIGGLGIMTFTGLLAYLAAGSVSFHNQMALKSMVSSNRISNVLTIVTRIILVTLFFEAVGAALIFFSLNKNNFDTPVERLFFAVFHSISAFCNAGFSTESAGLYTETLRFNYSLHLILALLIILGGMGFPIAFNIFTFIRSKAKRLVNQFMHHASSDTETRILQINSRLALATTGILLLVGFLSYLTLEYRGSLQDHPTMIGKIITSFFGSVTPRTAGFNTVDLTKLTLPMVMLYLLFMWIGASPSSTGGGIKTTTFAVALLNLLSVARSRKRTEVFHTRISELSINRAFAVMLLSLLVIGCTILLIALSDGEKGILKIAFEAFSAFSTVGLTLGITPELSDGSKVVLVITMFIGRVGALTLLMAFVNQKREEAYQYPEEEIQF